MSLSYSKLKDFKSCPRKYLHAHVERIKKIEEAKEEHHSAWGIALHEALASYYKGRSDEEVTKAFTDSYPIHLDEQDQAKTPQTGIECFKLYKNWYGEKDSVWKVIEVEVKDQFEFRGIDWEVHVDMVAEQLQGGGLYLWDHKTTGKTPSFSYWLKYDMSDQLTAYTYWAKQKYGQCSGFIINNIAVGYRKNKYAGEPAGFWAKFERQIFNRSERQVEAWLKDVEQWNMKLEYARNDMSYPKNPGELCAYCNYRELCMSENDEQIRETLYETKQESDR